MALLLGFGDLWVVGRLRVLQGQNFVCHDAQFRDPCDQFDSICLLPVKLAILRNCCNAFQEVWLSYV